MTAWEPKLVADVLTNGFAAAALLVVLFNMSMSGAQNAMNTRLRLMLSLIAVLFSVRCVAWPTQNAFLLDVVDILAAMSPLAALFVAEGLLRRHAPKRIKFFILGAAVFASLTAFLPNSLDFFANIALLVAVAGGCFVVSLFLLIGNRDGLTSGEVATLRSIILTMMALTPLIATDFVSLWPNLPMRFGAVGTLVLLFISLGPGSVAGRGWERVVCLAVFTGIGVAFAVGYTAANQAGGWEHLIRAAVVGTSGLLFAALFAELLGARAERRKTVPAFLEAQSTDEFLSLLKTHELIDGVRILSGADITPLEHPDFRSLIASHAVLKQSKDNWGREATDCGVERAKFLLRTHEATHILRLAQEPIQLATLTFPPSITDARLESEIRVAQRVGELLFATRGNA